MMNLVQLQERLKDFSPQQLAKEMQMPTGNVPQYLVLGELQRRKRMESSAMQEQAQQNQTTVAQDVVAAAGVPQGGIAGMAQALAPQTNMGQNTGQAPVSQMAGGGVVKARDGVALRSQGFGGNVEYDYAAFLAEMGLRDTPDARDTFRRYQERMNADFAVNGPNSDPNLFMPFLDEAPRSLPSLGDVSTGLGAFSARSDSPTDVRTPLSLSPLGPEAMPFVDVTTPPAPAAKPEQGAMPMNAMELMAQQALGGSGPSRRLGQRGAGPATAPERRGYIPPNIGATELNLPKVRNATRPDTGAGLLTGLRDAADAFAEDRSLPGYREGNQSVPPGIMTNPLEVNQGDRPEFVDPALDYLRSLGSDARPQIGGFEISDEDLAVMDAANAAAEETRAYNEARRSAEEAAAARDAAGITDARGSMGAAIAEGRPEDAAAIAEAAREALDTPPVSNTTTTTTTPPGGGSGGSALGGSGTAVMSDLEKSLEQDKWLSLAKFGLALMSSQQPTLGGAIGEAGIAAVGDFQQAKKNFEEAKLARATLAARSAGGGARTPTIANMISYLDDLVRQRGELAPLPGMAPTPDQVMQASALDAEIDGVRAQLRASGMGAAPSLSGVASTIRTPSATSN